MCLHDYASCRASLETGTSGPTIDLSINCGLERGCVCDFDRGRSKGLAAWEERDANLVVSNSWRVRLEVGQPPYCINRLSAHTRRILRAFLWLSAVANLSLAVIIPIYALTNLTSLITLQTSGTLLRGADVVIDLIAVLIGLAIPGTMLLDPYSQGWMWQSTWLAIFGSLPGSVPLAKIAFQIVLHLAAVTLRGSHQVKRARLGPSIAQKALFGSGLVLSLIRGAALCHVILNAHITLWEFHVPSFDELQGAMGYSETCLTFMKLDFVLSAAAILVIAYHVLAARFPYHGWVLVVGVCLGGAVFGAGGTLLLVWGWRESWITSLSNGVRL